jgi:hypothetical protein
MQSEFFKIIGIIIVGFFIIYMIIKMFKLQKGIVEGLTNQDSNTDNSNLSSTSGEAGSSSSYSASIKALSVKLQDELLISKYRRDYENTIVNLDDLIGYMMIKQVLNLKLSTDNQSSINSLNNLNTLKQAKESLNTTMKFLDNQ